MPPNFVFQNERGSKMKRQEMYTDMKVMLQKLLARIVSYHLPKKTLALSNDYYKLLIPKLCSSFTL